VEEYLDLSIVLLKLRESKPCVYVPKEIKIWMIKVVVEVKEASLNFFYTIVIPLN